MHSLSNLWVNNPTSEIGLFLEMQLINNSAWQDWIFLTAFDLNDDACTVRALILGSSEYKGQVASTCCHLLLIRQKPVMSAYLNS